MEGRTNCGPEGLLTMLTAVITLFAAGVLVGLGVGQLAGGDLVTGAFVALLGAAMLWAATRGRPASPEA